LVHNSFQRHCHPPPIDASRAVCYTAVMEYLLSIIALIVGLGAFCLSGKQPESGGT